LYVSAVVSPQKKQFQADVKATVYARLLVYENFFGQQQAGEL
jgi:hypothetical protein